MNSLRLSSDVSPILLANVVINLNGCASTIQRIATSVLWAIVREQQYCYRVAAFNSSSASNPSAAACTIAYLSGPGFAIVKSTSKTTARIGSDIGPNDSFG